MRRLYFFYLVLFLISLGFIVSGTRITTLTQLPWRATYTFSLMVKHVREEGKSVVRSVVEATRLVEENKRLKLENLKLRQRLREYSFLARENSKLKNLLRIKRYLRRKAVCAEVVSWTGDYWEFEFILDKGKKDGVVEGMAVVGARGIVGIVTQVGENFSKAIANVDPRFSVHVEDYRSRVRGVVFGDGAHMKLKWVLPYMDVKPGDVLVSTGIGSVFPGGIVVGRVVKVVRSVESRFLDITVLPADRLENNRFVLLIGGIRF